MSLQITNNDVGSVVLKNASFRPELLAFPGIDTYVMGTILARRQVATAITPAADGGNTGDGTVTAAVVPGDIPKVGSYNLELISANVAKGTATATAAADGGNTGNGTVTALTVTADSVGLKPGAYNLEMTELGTKNGVAVGAIAADGGNTGDGAAGAVTAGSKAIAGDYILTCITAVGNGGVFKVIDPNGNKLKQLTVAVAYSSNHFGITIADGAADFIVGDFFTITMTDTGGLFKLVDPSGSVLQDAIIMDAGALAATVVEVEGITFTITAGATDFIVGDKFGITVANTAGLWKLVDPNGAIVSNTIESNAGAGTATIIEVSGLTFTITDGATDFVVGDKFALPVVADSDLVAYAIGGLGGSQIPTHVLTYAVTSTGAQDIPIDAMVSGEVRKERLIVDADGDGSNLTNAILDQLRSAGIVSINVDELNIPDNQ